MSVCGWWNHSRRFFCLFFLLGTLRIFQKEQSLLETKRKPVSKPWLNCFLAFSSQSSVACSSTDGNRLTGNLGAPRPPGPCAGWDHRTRPTRQDTGVTGSGPPGVAFAPGPGHNCPAQLSVPRTASPWGGVLIFFFLTS